MFIKINVESSPQEIWILFLEKKKTDPNHWFKQVFLVVLSIFTQFYKTIIYTYST